MASKELGYDLSSRPRKKLDFSFSGHSILIVFGVAALLIILGTIVAGAASSYMNPTTFGHNPGDIEAGTFFTTSPTFSDVWGFPGIVTVTNMLGIGTGAPSPAAPLHIQSGANPPVAVTAVGNVGIGTTTPAAPFEIVRSGAMARFGDTSGGLNHLILSKPASGNDWTLDSLRPGSLTVGGPAGDISLTVNGPVVATGRIQSQASGFYFPDGSVQASALNRCYARVVSVGFSSTATASCSAGDFAISGTAYCSGGGADITSICPVNGAGACALDNTPVSGIAGWRVTCNGSAGRVTAICCHP